MKTRHTFIKDVSESEPDESVSWTRAPGRESIKASRDPLPLPLPLEQDALRLLGAHVYSSNAAVGVFEIWSGMTDATCRKLPGRRWRVEAEEACADGHVG